MKKIVIFILIFCISLPLLGAEFEYDVKEVELNKNIVAIIRAFIEYSHECDSYSDYPVDNILFLSLRYPPHVLKDSSEKKLVMEFYPDELNFYQYERPLYVSYINILDSTYNIYIVIDQEVGQTWSKYQDYGFFVLSDRRVTIIQKSEEEQKYEYDPPYVKMWCITSPFTKRNGYYVEWGTTQYCW